MHLHVRRSCTHAAQRTSPHVSQVMKQGPQLRRKHVVHRVHGALPKHVMHVNDTACMLTNYCAATVR